MNSTAAKAAGNQIYSILEKWSNGCRNAVCLPDETRARLPGWWKRIKQLTNRIASVYLRALVLTDARKGELAAPTWAHVDFHWHELTLPCKADHKRAVSLTHYLAQLLATLPLVNSFIFASIIKTGRISDLRSSHTKLLQGAGIDYLTFHGLRRTFA